MYLMAGWVAGSAGIKANSASNKVKVEAEAELGTSLKIYPSFSGGKGIPTHMWNSNILNLP